MIGYSSLASLPRLRDYTSHRESSYDKTGGNRDSWGIKRGEKRILADIKGPGCIKHIWMTGIGDLRKNVLRIYWDDCPEPSVECPIGDFFGMGHGLRKNFVSLPLQMSPQNGQGFNSWWPMPFKRRAIIEVENQTIEESDPYFYIDYEKYRSSKTVEGLAYFHVQWRRESDTEGWSYKEEWSDKKELNWEQEKKDQLFLRKQEQKDPRFFNKDGKDNYLILEAEGEGIYCGAHLDIDCFVKNTGTGGLWYGEGDDMVFIDGEEWPPSLHGTGTEDWFNCAFVPSQEYNAPYHGVILYSRNNDWPFKGKHTVYRYYIEDPIRFYKSIKATIEHGHANNYTLDYSSTAYYYMSEPKRGGPPLPPVEERLPRPNEEPNKLKRSRKN